MLVSSQTNQVPGTAEMMRELISSCYEARERFRSAAAISEDSTVMRLFEIYAQQRTRFAEELREHLPASQTGNGAVDERVGCDWLPAGHDLLRSCVESDSRTLQLYRRALASRDLPTRTRFLIASQLALLERAHERVNSLVDKPELAGRSVALNSPRARA
jgi:hypothetical protein